MFCSVRIAHGVGAKRTPELGRTTMACLTCVDGLQESGTVAEAGDVVDAAFGDGEGGCETGLLGCG